MSVDRTENKNDRKGLAQVGYCLKYLMNFLRPYKGGLILGLLMVVVANITFAVMPVVEGEMTTQLFSDGEAILKGVEGAHVHFDVIFGIMGTLVIIYIIKTVSQLITAVFLTRVLQQAMCDIRNALQKKIQRLPVRYFDDHAFGDVLSCVTNDVDTLQMSLNQSMTQLITSVTTLIGVFIMMLSINVWMTLAALLILPVSMLIINKVMKHSQKYFQAQQDYLGRVNGQIEENFGGHDVVRVFNKEQDVLTEFERDNGKLYESAWKSQFFSGMMMPIMQFVGNLGYVMVALLGGIFVIKGRIEVGDIQSFFQYIRNFTQPIQQVAQVANMLQSTAAASERVFEFLDEKEEDQFAENPVSVEGLQGNVEFEHVHFGYNPEHIIINDFSAKVKEGQKIAIVGPTGAGKTTMIKLLMRFYDVNSGAIKIDGHNIKDFNRSELRQMFGMVLQDTWLFSGSIEDNIKYGKLDATHEEVVAAAKAAHVHRFVQTLPSGYNMILNEEASNVSQGQKQLLTIARAILADPKILILDEATSSVDTRTEVQIQKAMDNLMKGRTSFVIAHRLSTIRDADLILVMKDGDIIEQGNHEELLEKNGFYAELYNSQFENVTSCA